MVIVVIPTVLALLTQSVRPAWQLISPFSLLVLGAGLLPSAFGMGLLAWTISLFSRVGEGTLAPWDPTRKLVAVGPYRHVRNPMISGVIFILLGEAILMGSMALFYWFSFFVIVNIIYIPLLEEPGLERRFGEAYQDYKKNVPRWIPRIHPWEPLVDT